MLERREGRDILSSAIPVNNGGERAAFLVGAELLGQINEP